MFLRITLSVFMTACLFVPTAVMADDRLPPLDGVYCHGAEDGVPIDRDDGASGQLILGSRLAESFDSMTITSETNDNSRFRVDATATITESRDVGAHYYALVAAGLVMPAGGHTEPEGEGQTITFMAQLGGLENAEKVAEAMGAELKLRTHPRHRWNVTWTPDKKAYKPGEPITLTLSITNVGRRTFSFMNGGMNRGPRNNQFAFIAHSMYGYGKAVPDAGDPANFGGLAGLTTLEPGETFTIDAPLNSWFDLTEPDTYRITGMFRIGICNDSWRSIWDDFAVGECTVYIEAEEE